MRSEWPRFLRLSGIVFDPYSEDGLAFAVLYRLRLQRKVEVCVVLK